MAAILNSAMLDSDTAILDSDTLLSSLRFTQKHSHSILTLTQTNSIWLKLIHSHSTWWWQPSWILPGWIQITAILDSDILLSSLRFTQKHSHWFWLWLKLKSSLIHSDSTWWWQPSWILPSWIFSILDSAILVFPLRLLTLAKIGSHICTKKLHSFILTQLDDGSHLEFCHQIGFCHLGFRHLVILSQIWLKTLSLHSDSDSN